MINIEESYQETYLVSCSAVLKMSESPEANFPCIVFNASSPSAGRVSSVGHAEISLFTRPIVSRVLGFA